MRRLADAEYADSIASPIREAQALVAGNRMAVIWRLLSYLRPYRKHVLVGVHGGHGHHAGELGAAVPGGHADR